MQRHRAEISRSGEQIRGEGEESQPVLWNISLVYTFIVEMLVMHISFNLPKMPPYMVSLNRLLYVEWKNDQLMEIIVVGSY